MFIVVWCIRMNVTSTWVRNKAGYTASRSELWPHAFFVVNLATTWFKRDLQNHKDHHPKYTQLLAPFWGGEGREGRGTAHTCQANAPPLVLDMKHWRRESLVGAQRHHLEFGPGASCDGRLECPLPATTPFTPLYTSTMILFYCQLTPLRCKWQTRTLR